MPIVHGTIRGSYRRNLEEDFRNLFAQIVNDEDPWWRQQALSDASDGKVCSLCLGIGWTREDHPIGHDRFGQLFECVCRNGESKVVLEGEAMLMVPAGAN